MAQYCCQHGALVQGQLVQGIVCLGDPSWGLLLWGLPSFPFCEVFGGSKICQSAKRLSFNCYKDLWPTWRPSDVFHFTSNDKCGLVLAIPTKKALVRAVPTKKGLRAVPTKKGLVTLLGPRRKCCSQEFEQNRSRNRDFLNFCLVGPHVGPEA